MKQLKTVRLSWRSSAVPWWSLLSNILLSALFAGSTLSAAACDGQCHRCAEACGCGTRDLCSCRRTTEKVKQQCWKVSCKKICIPPIRFPWPCGCLTGCGKVRTVRVLEKEESKEARHVYQWSVRTVRTGNGCHRNGCRENACNACRADAGYAKVHAEKAPTAAGRSYDNAR